MKNSEMAAAQSKSARGWRLWLGRLLLALGVPTLLFGGLELTLHLVGYGRSTDFFIRDDRPGFYRTNPHFTDAFFPASFGLKPVNFRLPEKKPAGEFRIFVVGESAAMGVPEPGFGVVPQLQAQLRAAYPGRPIQVYNLGITAINSHAILPIVQQAARFSPDLFVVYMGNNEVVGPYGPSSVATVGVPSRALVRLSLWIRGTRTGQLLGAALRALRPESAGFKDWRGMEMFADKAVAADDPRLGKVYANFSANLADILDAAHSAGAGVVLSTVAVNLRDCAPFVSRHAADLSAAQLSAWEKATARGADAEALAIDPGYAETHFHLARALEAQGDGAGARKEYLAARERDALRFRADAQINDLIRAAARTHASDAVLVDAAREMGADASSEVAPAGGEFFFEHVHLTWKGNYTLARLLAGGAARRMGGAASWLGEEDCAAALGFTAFGRVGLAREMELLTGRPPFINQSNYAESRARLADEIETAEAAMNPPGALNAMVARVEAARQRSPDNLFLWAHESILRLQLGDATAALALNERLAELQPPAPEQAVQRAFFLLQLKRPAEAEALLLETARTSPYYFQTYGLLAQTWAVTRAWPRANDYFPDLLRRMPGSLAVRHAYADLLVAEGNGSAAEAQWREILQIMPDDEAALGPLGARLLQRHQDAEAVELMQAAFAYNPRSFANDQRLVELFDARGEAEQTVKYMQALAASGPVNTLLYRDLALYLGKLGRRSEMHEALLHGREVARRVGDDAGLAEINRLLSAE